VVHAGPVESQSLVGFAQTARALAAGTRAAGLLVPAFRTPPKRSDAVRTIRRLPGGAVVAVRVRGRSHADVVRDMVEGVVQANGLDGEAAVRLRTTLLEAVLGRPKTPHSAAA
jgi:hypothetical protein